MQGLGEPEVVALSVEEEGVVVVVVENSDRENGDAVELSDLEKPLCVVQMEGRTAARISKIAALFWFQNGHECKEATDERGIRGQTVVDTMDADGVQLSCMACSHQRRKKRRTQ